MMPNLRSVFAQVHRRNSRWIGSRRNFSSSPSNESNGAGEKVVGWYVRRGLALVAGFAIGAYKRGDTETLEEKMRRDLKKAEESFERTKIL